MITNISKFNANFKSVLLIIHLVYFLFMFSWKSVLYSDQVISPSRYDIFFSSYYSSNPRVTTLIWFNAICSDNSRGQLSRSSAKFNLQRNRLVPTFTDVWGIKGIPEFWPFIPVWTSRYLDVWWTKGRETEWK